MTIFGKNNWFARKSIIAYTSFELEDVNGIKKKKHVLLEDELSNVLQIWMVATSVDEVFLTNWSVFPIMVTFYLNPLKILNFKVNILI